MTPCVQVSQSTWVFLCMVIGFIAAALTWILWKLSDWRKPTGVIRGDHLDGSEGGSDE